MYCSLSILLASSAHAAPHTHDGKFLLFGNLHAHSRLSDDIKKKPSTRSPQGGFEHAMEAGLDFLAITDHHKATDSTHRLWLEGTVYQDELVAAARRVNEQHAGEFVAIPGFEWGNTATGNHVNVLGAPTVPPDTILDTDYRELFEWAEAQGAVAQLNHPKSWYWKSNRDKSVGNFGMAQYADELAWATALSPVVGTMSIICSVEGGHLTGRHRRSEDKTHRDMQWEPLYREFLNHGLRLGPSANQDTHGRNFGTVTAARTAVWADAVDLDSTLEALRANRVYATEDDELAVAFGVKLPGGEAVWMGDELAIGPAQTDVVATVRIWQTPGVDGDSRAEGPYTVRIVGDPDGVGGQQASVWRTLTGLRANHTHEIELYAEPGQYIYVHVTEENGSDNLVGQGEDATNNETGAHGKDGLRDDPNDDAWTAPVWFTAQASAPPTPDGAWVWSRASGVYHRPDCWAVDWISATNRRSGDDAGTRTPHACKLPATDP